MYTNQLSKIDVSVDYYRAFERDAEESKVRLLAIARSESADFPLLGLRLELGDVDNTVHATMLGDDI